MKKQMIIFLRTQALQLPLHINDLQEQVLR